MQLKNYNPYTDREPKDCRVCHEFPDVLTNVVRTDCNTVKSNPICNTDGCSTKWLDTAMLEYKFGIDYCNGISMSRWLPGWLIDYCPTITKPTDLGYPDPCVKNLYYKISQDGFVYAVQYDCDGKQSGPSKQLKSWQIQDCAIAGIDASKIINPCKIFTTSKLAKPISNYTVSRNGVDTIDPNIHFLDIVITDDCQLKAAYLDKIARQAVLPSISCLINYDIANDIAKVDLSKVIDGKTIRVTQATGNCDKLYSYTYAQDNILGDGTDVNPLIANVRTDGITITGNGTTASPLRAVQPTSNVYVDPLQFSGDGKTQATQYSIKPCVIANTFFTGYSSSISFSEPLKAGYIIQASAVGQASKAIRSNGLVWTLSNLPTPCAGKRLLGEIKIRIKSAANIPSFPVHLFGDVSVSNGSWLYADAVQPLPQVQVSSGINAEYGDSRGYCADISYLVYLNGGTASFTISPTVIFPNGKDPAIDKPTNVPFPSGIPQDSWFESVSAQFLLHHVE